MYEDYKSISTSIRDILGKTVKEISNESTDEYRKSLEKIAKDRQLKGLSKKDKDTLIKIANLMKRANEALDQGDEAKVKEIIGLLRKASDSHAKQADDLQKAVDEDAETTAADASSKDMPLGKIIKRKEDEDEVNEVKTSVFTLNDMDDNDAATVIAMAKRAGVFLRSKKVSMKRSDVQLKGDKKKIFKFINSLPESIQINESTEAENKLKRLTRKKVTVITPNDSFTGKLVFKFGYLNRSEYFVRGYENEIFTARDVKSILGNKIKLTKNFDAMESTNEALEAGPIDPRTLAGKIITGEVKLLTVYQGSPGGRQTYILATGKPSVMGAPPDSIYIDATGSRPKGSGLAIGWRLDAVKKSFIRRDGSARVELK